MKRNTLKDHKKERALFSSRAMLAGGIILLLSTILIARMAYLQITEKNLYTTLSQKNQLALLPIEPTRGLIYDRNGVLVAQNMPVFSLEIIPDKVRDLNNTLAGLQELIDISPDNIQQFYKLLKQHRRFDTVPLRLKLDPDEVAKFYINQYRFPGVTVKAQLIRYYPLGPGMVDVLGYMGRINDYELSQVDDSNYVATNYIGKLGIEKYYEKELHGAVGYQQVETDASGRIVRTLHRTPPVPGENIYLTIDSRLQITAKNALSGHRGAVVAIQPQTGEILAMVSNPNYDPNLFVQGMTTKVFATLQQDPNQPLFNRAIRGQYPLGSTIKPFTALKGLEEGVITPKTKIYDPGFYQLSNNSHHYRDWRKAGHGWVDVTKAIAVSCDTFFYKLGFDLKIKRIDEVLTAFGFGSTTGVDMGEELPGLVPSPDWKKSHERAPWYPGDTVISAIGQGFMLTTPLQLANATATYSMKGIGYRPHLRLKTQLADGSWQVTYPQALPPVKVSPQAWQVVTKAMEMVVSSRIGTGYRFGRKHPYTAAAKTGTAQLISMEDGEDYKDVPARLRDNSVFIVFAPVENPQIAVAVVVENNPMAPNVARKVVDRYLLDLLPSYRKKQNLQKETS